ncbi:MAG: hypothetical protein E7206_17880 [Clostridium beijerinckii]|nr:hypothetical protein [Clostridium beijerinckii]
MTKEKWQEEADELIDKILDNKEKVKMYQEELDSYKGELVDLLEKQNINEYSGEKGKCNFVDFQRVGLIKEEVETTVEGVNKGKIKQINIRDLQKDISVHFLNVRGYI